MYLSLYWALGCDCEVHLTVMIELHEKGKKKCCSYRDDRVWSELTWDPNMGQAVYAITRSCNLGPKALPNHILIQLVVC